MGAQAAERQHERQQAEEAGDLASGKRTWKLSPEQEAALEQRRIEGQIISAIASQSWGQNLTGTMRRAISQYCLRYGIDPLTELDVLGGTMYPNSEFYLRKLGELRQQGIVKDFYFERISNDPELLRVAGDESSPAEVRDWSKQEHWKRWRRRRELGAREEATNAVAFHIILASGGHDIVGWKQAGGGTAVKQWKHDGGAKPNPIVEDPNNGALSVESQAVRRAVRQIASHVKGASSSPLFEIAKQFSALEQDAEVISEEVTASKPPEPDVTPMAQTPLALNPGSEYDEAAVLQAQLRRKLDDAGRPEPVQTVVHMTTTPAVQRALSLDDPYADTRADNGAERVAPSATADAQPAPAESTAAVRPVPLRHTCQECRRNVAAPEEHDPDCSHYADPD